MGDPTWCAFFELDALGSLRRSPAATEPDHCRPYPDVVALLERLRSEGGRLGVLGPAGSTNNGLARLIAGGELDGLLDPDLRVADEVGSPVARAVQAAAGADVVVVSPDRERRSEGLQAGARVAPHPRLTVAVLRGEHLHYVQLTAGRKANTSWWHTALADLDVVALRVSGSEAAESLAIAAEPAIEELERRGVQVVRLGREDQPLSTEVYILRSDTPPTAPTAPASQAGHTAQGLLSSDQDAAELLAPRDDALVVALGAGQSVESYHLPGARHGHTDKLQPTQSVVTPNPRRPVAPLPALPEDPGLNEEERRAVTSITAEALEADLARYTGVTTANGSGARIRSRHVVHPDNITAVRTLAADLAEAGDGQLEVTLHPFLHEGRPLDNVEAELTGSEDELVLVTAHLDSTAQFSQGYDPKRDPAPGADDDASGTVGVLAIARVLAALARLTPPRRTLRFVLFNAEEHGLVGSTAYALEQAALGAPIQAVIQIDMMGYNREPPPTYEVHAGFAGSPEVEKRSTTIAERIAAAAHAVAPELPAPQIYRTTLGEPDPADGRSDHTSFQEVGYAACVVTEDFFTGPTPRVPAEANPNYHTADDTFVDTTYAAGIARAICAAAWLMSRS